MYCNDNENYSQIQFTESNQEFDFASKRILDKRFNQLARDLSLNLIVVSDTESLFEYYYNSTFEYSGVDLEYPMDSAVFKSSKAFSIYENEYNLPYKVFQFLTNYYIKTILLLLNSSNISSTCPFDFNKIMEFSESFIRFSCILCFTLLKKMLDLFELI